MVSSTMSMGSDTLFFETDEFSDSNEKYVDEYEITNGAIGIKNDDGSMTRTIGATIETSLEV